MAGGGIKVNNIKVSGGADGATFTPSVDENGNLSWDNDRGYANPPTVNIKGADGKNGADGKTGAKILSQTFKGEDANGGYIYEQVFDDGTVLYFTAPRGEKGEKGEDGESPEGYISLTEKGRPDGVATLNSNGEIPQEQLPDLDYVEKTGDTMSGALNIKNDDLKEVSVSSDGISFNMDGTSGKRSGFNRDYVYLYTSGVASGTEVKSDGVTVDFMLLSGKVAKYLVDGIKFTYNGASHTNMKFPTDLEGEQTFAMLSDVLAVEEFVRSFEETIMSLETKVILQNQVLLQSGIIYTANDVEVWNERVTANGLNVLDGSKAVLKKVVGSTVACKNLFNFDEIAKNDISQNVQNLVDYTKKSIHFSPANNMYALGAYGSKFDILNAVLNITEAGVYSLRIKVTDINGNALPNAEIRSPWAIATSEGTNGSDSSYLDGLYYLTKWTFTAEDIANFKNTASFRLYMYTARDKTTKENVDCYVSEFTFSKGDYTLETMPRYTPYFTGLKSASFAGIESTNADGTETSTLDFPKTETPLGTTIDFEQKKITDYGKTLVFDGKENWGYYAYQKYQSVTIPDFSTAGNKAVADYVSTDSKKTGAGYDSGNMWCGYSGSSQFMWLGILAKLGYLEAGTTPTAEEQATAISKFKAWLAERYASGNPVTVRYLARDVQSETDITDGNEYTAYKGGTEKVLDNDGAEFGVKNELTVNYMFVTEVEK